MTRHTPARTGSGARPTSRARRRGFTLVEALVALTLTAMASAVLLLASHTALDTSSEAVDRTIALGMARQLMDEILGRRYHAPHTGPYDWPLGPSPTERNGAGRERFNDVDDYNGFATDKAEDMWSIPLGEDDGQGSLRHSAFRIRDRYFADWRQAIDVYYVDPADHSVRLAAGVTSDFRAVEVAISRESADGVHRELARLRQVVAWTKQP